MRPSLFALFALGCIDSPVDDASQPFQGVDLDNQVVHVLGDGQLTNTLHPTGSSTIVALEDGTTTFNVNPDSANVTRTVDGEIFVVPVGEEPTRITRAGDALFVTLRADRSLAKLSVSEFEQGVQQTAELGAEPFSVVVSEGGHRVYVSLSMEDRVVELDGQTLEVLRSFHVPREPRFLALHPSGRQLWVGSVRGEALLTHIDLLTEETRAQPLPPTQRHIGEPLGSPDWVPLTPRITGDLWITAQGDRLLVPTLYVDNTSPIVVEQPDPNQVEQEFEYASAGGNVGRLNPALDTLALRADGQPAGTGAALFAPSFVASFFDPVDDRANGFLSSVSASPDGRFFAATQQGTDTIMLFGTAAVMDAGFGFNAPSSAGFIVPNIAAQVTRSGPDGVAWSSDDLFVHSGFAKQVERANRPSLEAAADENASLMTNFGTALPRAPASIQVGAHVLPDAVERGRLLFHSASEASMTQGGVSCATCHFDGRNDGLTWTFEAGVRQTPSLAGVVSETAPVTWTDQVESVQMEAHLTTTLRMGGGGLSEAQLSDIAAYVDWTRIPDTAPDALDPAAVARGEEIFERPTVGCAYCHAGSRHTDNQSYWIGGIEGVNTPTLTGISATAPYLHDGSLPTLRAVLEWAKDGSMGNTSDLTDAELDDLETYLRSL